MNDRVEQLELLPPENPAPDWTFRKAATRTLTHCYHDYPARMIPQVAGKLLDLFAKNTSSLFDPYCGTGTSLVEGFIRGIDVAGTDLNPLARLIAQAKTSIPKGGLLEKQLSLFQNYVSAFNGIAFEDLPQISGINDLRFWFKDSVIEKLAYLNNFIEDVAPQSVRLFFQVAFSETVRDCSNTRNHEFKLYRYDEAQLEKFKPDVFGTMFAKLIRNLRGFQEFSQRIGKLDKLSTAHIYDFNSVHDIPQTLVLPESIDIVITSPPYGDSRTTVAYGQYSRLSAAWLGLHEPAKVDARLMGGTLYKELLKFPCDALHHALRDLQAEDVKRHIEVTAFYSDLYHSIQNVSTVIRPGGYACYVVGNRKVKGVVLPTDCAVRSFFESTGFMHINTFTRTIPNKRMPLRNSPSNQAGKVETTMNAEYIVVMRKR